MGVILFSRGARVTEQNTRPGIGTFKVCMILWEKHKSLLTGLAEHGLPWFAMVRHGSAVKPFCRAPALKNPQ